MVEILGQNWPNLISLCQNISNATVYFSTTPSQWTCFDLRSFNSMLTFKSVLQGVCTPMQEEREVNFSWFLSFSIITFLFFFGLQTFQHTVCMLTFNFITDPICIHVKSGVCGARLCWMQLALCKNEICDWYRICKYSIT